MSPPADNASTDNTISLSGQLVSDRCGAAAGTASQVRLNRYRLNRDGTKVLDDNRMHNARRRSPVEGTAWPDG